MITGNPEDNEYIGGKNKPKTLVMVIGINIPKNKTALYGQNEIEKRKPSNAAFNLFRLLCLP